MTHVRFFLMLAPLFLATAAAAQVKGLPDGCEPEVIEIENDLFSQEQWQLIKARSGELPNGEGRLWRIEGANGAVSYLWGTYHSSDTRISNVPDEVKELIAGARIFMPEAPGADVTMADIAEWWDNYTMIDPDGPIIPSLPPEVQQAIAARFVSLGWDPSMTFGLSSRALFESLLSHPCEDRLRAAGYPIQDMRIELLAADAGVEIRAAEPRDALDALHEDPRWSEAEHDTISLYALWSQVSLGTATHLALYLQGRIGDMMAADTVLLSQEFPDLDVSRITASSDAFILDYRNRLMVQTVAPELVQGGAVVAVGCYHLPGANGLISLLRAEGFIVTRVILPGEAG